MLAGEGELGDEDEAEDAWVQCARCKCHRSVAESVRNLYAPRNARFECKFVLPNGCKTAWRDGPERQWYGDESHLGVAPPGAEPTADADGRGAGAVVVARRLELAQGRSGKPAKSAKPVKAVKPAKPAGKARKVAKTVAKEPPPRTSRRSGRVLKLPEHVQPFLDFEFKEET